MTAIWLPEIIKPGQRCSLWRKTKTYNSKTTASRKIPLVNSSFVFVFYESLALSGKVKAFCRRRKKIIKSSVKNMIKKSLWASYNAMIFNHVLFYWIQWVQAELHPTVLSQRVKEKEMFLQLYLVSKINFILAWDMH